ncbi:MAG: peptide chain release factor N(5)-glutamine methyltransferase [Frankiaceae bacterium]
MTPVTGRAAGVALPAAIRAAATRLAGAGVPSPGHDAQALAAHALGVPAGGLAAIGELGGAELAAYEALVERRRAREPLQHITGSAPFRYLDLAVGPGVFVPRPETELVAQAAIDAARAAGPHPLVVDLCTGSGVIALAVAMEVPGARVHGVEREADALRWATRNVAATRLPVELHHEPAESALAGLAGRVDVVVSNPPYVPDDERGTVEPEVRHDPDAALWGGPDGLATVRAVVAAAARLLRPGGALVVEHSDRHGEAVPALLAGSGGWEAVRDHADLAGRPRYVTVRRAP